MNNNLKRFASFLSSILTVSIFLSVMPIRELRADADTHREYYPTPFEVVYEQNSTWDNTTQGGFTVTNTSDESVDSWKFEIEYLYPVIVNNIWDANLIGDPTLPATTIIVENTASNGFIASGNSINFGIIAQGEEATPIAPIAVRLVTEGNEDIVPTPSVTPYPTEEITPTPTVTEIPEEITEVFPYVIFSGSNNYDFTFNGWKSDILGDVYTGSNFQYNGSELTLDGKVQSVGNINASGWNITIGEQEENVSEIDMPNWGYYILERGNELPVIDTSRFTTDDPILTDGYCYVDGDIVISGTTFEGDAIIVANGDITYNINEISGDGRVLLYSENGNITINGTEIDINGVLYAPNGSVSINAYETTVTGRIIADKVCFYGSILNCYLDVEDTENFHPTPEVTTTPEPSVTIEPSIEPSVTPEENITPTPSIVDDSSLIISLDTNQFVESEYGGLYYIFTPIETVSGTLSDSTNVESFTYAISSIYEENVVVGDLPISDEWSTNSIGFFLGPTRLILTAETSDGQVWNQEYVFFSYTYLNADRLGIDIISDDDSDGLPNYFENEIGTNPNCNDTDEDGLDDFEEIYIFSTSPINPDSDNDGIIDGNEDADSDGLVNVCEIDLGTNPIVPDSDGDGLSDYDELNIYFTNPNNPDTDDDNISDGVEVSIGKNPNDETDAELKVEQIVTLDINNTDDAIISSVDITMSYESDINRVVQIVDLYNLDTYSTEVYGRLGSPIGLFSNIDFDVATLTIHYDENQLNGTIEENLGVLWYDDATGLYFEQTQAVIDTINNTVTVELNHFSTYVLVDLDKWNNPIIPDYSDFIHIVHEEMNDYGCNAYVPSQESLDREAWAWWHLTRDNMVKLGTLNFESINTRSFWYDFHFDWLVLDTSDSNRNGVPDYLENSGVLGTNRHIYNYEDVSRRFGNRFVFYNDGRVFTNGIQGFPFDQSYAPIGGAYWRLYYNLHPSNDPDALIDNDYDGLYENAPRYNAAGEVILPQDPDDGCYDAYYNLIKKHYEYVFDGEIVATELENTQVGCMSFPFELDSRVSLLENGESLWDELCEYGTGVYDYIQNASIYETLSLLGCTTLWFYDDNLSQAAHSKYEQWQRYFGYCDFYDSVFRAATGGNIDILKFPSFDYNGEQYIFWGWRGTYLNLGTGGELGLYYIPGDNRESSYTLHSSQVMNGISSRLFGNSESAICWSIAPYELDMELHVYTKESGTYNPVFNWAPDDKQWWITGFDYHEESWNPNVNDLYYIAIINFGDVTSSHDSVDGIGLYSAFKVRMSDYKWDKPATIIFDDDTHSVYVFWGRHVNSKIYT